MRRRRDGHRRNRPQPHGGLDRSPGRGGLRAPDRVACHRRTGVGTGGELPAVGRLAPLIEGEDLDGQWFDIDDHRGQWVVVNFFSTTCVPCIVEHPELVAFAEERAITGDAVVVSVAFDDASANVRDFFLANGGEWPVITTDTGSIAVDYGVTAVPESYLVAPSGVVAAKLIGGITKDDLDNQIEDLVARALADTEVSS